MQSCDALFHGDKTDFLAKCTSQPPVLKEKSTSQVVRSTSHVVSSTSQVTGCASEVVRSASQVAATSLQVRKSYEPHGVKSLGVSKSI